MTRLLATFDKDERILEWNGVDTVAIAVSNIRVRRAPAWGSHLRLG